MGYAERNVWAGIVVSLVVMAVYLALVLPQFATMPVADIAWQWPMAWSIGGGIVVTIVLSILWGIVAGIRHPGQEHRADIRDRDIERMGSRVGQAFSALGGLTALVLAMIDADAFWIAHAIYLGFFLAALIGGIAQTIAYRRGLV